MTVGAAGLGYAHLISRNLCRFISGCVRPFLSLIRLSSSHFLCSHSTIVSTPRLHLCKPSHRCRYSMASRNPSKEVNQDEADRYPRLCPAVDF